jgi:hypothetical protein
MSVAENDEVAISLGESATTTPGIGRLALTITIMSTVLHPVGPLGARVYWLRRAVLIGVVVVLVVVVIVVFSGGSGKPKAKSPPPTHPTTTTSSSPPPTKQTSACDPSSLKLVLSTDSDTYTAGQTPTLIGEFTNSSSTACTLTTSPSQQIWRITSGTDKIWTNKGCTTAGASKQLKLKAGGTKMVSISWDGRRIESGCTPGSVVLPGEYVLHATLNGVKGQPAVFHVTS